MDSRTILTIMPDYGMGPFLWFNEGGAQGGVGPNCCDGTGACGYHPMSEQLWLDLSAWSAEFTRVLGDCELDCSRAGTDFDWQHFHARGMALALRLKDEVGDAYRVVYLKPAENFAGRSRPGARCEILADGRTVPLRLHRDLALALLLPRDEDGQGAIAAV